MLKPSKFVCNQFKDNRGNLLEIVPKKIKKKFVYSILTESKKNVIRGMHFNKQMDEEKLVFILDGKILDVTINLNKGKNFGTIFYN
jgi:dTDP-4-dehydrorhamnose 3,5-epimerase